MSPFQRTVKANFWARSTGNSAWLKSGSLIIRSTVSLLLSNMENCLMRYITSCWISYSGERAEHRPVFPRTWVTGVNHLVFFFFDCSTVSDPYPLLAVLSHDQRQLAGTIMQRLIMLKWQSRPGSLNHLDPCKFCFQIFWIRPKWLF